MTDTVTKTLSSIYIDHLNKFAAKVNKFGANVLVFDSADQCVLSAGAGRFESNNEKLAEFAQIARRKSEQGIQKFGDFQQVLALHLTEDNKSHAVIIVDTGISALSIDENLKGLCDQYNIDCDVLDNAIKNVTHEVDYLVEILDSFAQELKYSIQATQQLEMVSTELAQTYEELILLYNLSTNMKVTQSNANYLQMACDQLTQLISVEGIAIFLEKTIDRQKRLTLIAGAGVVAIDQIMADILQNHVADELRKGKEALLDSNVDSPFNYNWPERIRNIIAVPLYGNDKMIGIMVATNAMNKPDFDSTDVKLFNSVANQCAIFIENGRLFKDLKELFIGSLKALTNSIDAKDQYTRGHSERVAFISRWIAEQLAEKQPITEEQIHHIYLAGLLHDIGKIGVSESVLRKKGKLSDGELGRIKAHPRIGAAILSEIKQMREIVPGVLCHHERIDGKGYPEGLADDQIPLIGKIISLADAFDAMTSKRVYRDAMSITRAMAEVEKAAGTQFDETVAKVFLDSDIRKLWSIIQDGFIESWDYSNFSEYGTVAVGALIR
jgi:HD-GYP domain-containing protein (c-di-GMP phosphodiesterase class II)